MLTVKIELGGEEIELIPTLAAMEFLNKKYENFQAVYARLASMDFNSYVDVIQAGTLQTIKATGKKFDVDGAKQDVFEAGILTLMSDLIRFVSILLNGGRESAQEEEPSNPET